MSLETLQVIDATPLLNLYDAICKLREFNAPEMNDNMDGIIEIEYDIDMRSDKMVSFKKAAHVTLAHPSTYTLVVNGHRLTCKKK